MEHVIVVLVLIAVAGVIAYLKVPALKAKVDGLLNRGSRTPQNAQPEDANSGLAKPPVVPSLDTREGWESWRNSFPGSTRAFVMTWEQKLERDKLVAASQGPGVDRSGFELNQANGWLVTPILTNGSVHYFTTTKPGTVRVFGASGNQVNKVNGVEVGAAREGRLNVAAGPFTVVVESVNETLPVAVQVQGG